MASEKFKLQSGIETLHGTVEYTPDRKAPTLLLLHGAGTGNAPRWILVEMHDLQAGRKEIGKLLGKRYSEHSTLSPLDVLYKRSDVKES